MNEQTGFGTSIRMDATLTHTLLTQYNELDSSHTYPVTLDLAVAVGRQTIITFLFKLRPIPIAQRTQYKPSNLDSVLRGIH